MTAEQVQLTGAGKKLLKYNTCSIRGLQGIICLPIGLGLSRIPYSIISCQNKVYNGGTNSGTQVGSNNCAWE